MKNLIYGVIFLLLITSCDQVVFQEPQPRKTKAFTEIPEILQGTYLDHNDDTLHVYKQSFSYFTDEYSSIEKEYLSDSSVLKTYKDMFFFNKRVIINEEIYWLTYILEPVESGKQIDLYTMDPGDVVKLARLQEITSKVKDIENGEGDYYLFAPKKKHYKKIISDTIFTKMITFKKIEPRK